jgi:hypothetical protein
MSDPNFSYRPRQAPAVDPALRRIALLAAGIVVLVVGVALVWGGGRMALSFQGPPVIEAPAVPLRVVPPDPGGLVVPEADQPIMSGQGSNAPSQLAPAQPVPDVAGFEQASGQKLMTAPLPPPAPAAPVAVAVVPTVPKPVLPQSAAPKPVLPKPVVAKPVVVATVPKPVLPPPVTAAVAVKPKRILVHLPAAASEAAAEAEWARLQRAVPAMAAGKPVRYVQEVVNGKTVWRPEVSGFGDAGSAQIFCAVASSQGQGCAAGAF